MDDSGQTAVGWFESSLDAHILRYLFSCCGGFSFLNMSRWSVRSVRPWYLSDWNLSSLKPEVPDGTHAARMRSFRSWKMSEVLRVNLGIKILTILTPYPPLYIRFRCACVLKHLMVLNISHYTGMLPHWRCHIPRIWREMIEYVVRTVWSGTLIMLYTTYSVQTVLFFLRSRSLPSADSGMAVVSFWWKNVHKYWLTV